MIGDETAVELIVENCCLMIVQPFAIAKFLSLAKSLRMCVKACARFVRWEKVAFLLDSSSPLLHCK